MYDFSETIVVCEKSTEQPWVPSHKMNRSSVPFLVVDREVRVRLVNTYFILN